MLEEPGGPAPLTRKQLRLRRIAAEAPVEARGPDGPPLGAPPAESWTSPSAEARRLAHYAFALDDNSYQAPAGPESYWGTAVAAAAAPAAPAPRAAATGTAAPAAGTALAASGTAVDSALATGTAVDPALAAPVQHGTPARRADAWTGREDQRPSYLSHRVAEQEQSRATAAGSPSPNAARAAVPPAGAASPAAPLAGMSSPAQAPYPVALPSVTATPVATVAAALATAAQEAALATEPRPALSAPSGAAHAHAGSAMMEKAATPARARIQPGRALANAWAAMLAKASTPTRNSNARARLRPRRALANGWVAARSAPSAGELAATPGPAASGALEDATLRQDRPRVRIRPRRAFANGWADLVARSRAMMQVRRLQVAGAAASALLVGAALIGLGGPGAAPLPPGQDALSPLAQTIEAVSRRSMADLTSRSMTAQLVDEAAAEDSPEIVTRTRSNVGLVLNWDISAVAEDPEAQLVLRRGVGDAPPQTPAEGVDVPLPAEAGSVQDYGLQPDTAYSYTLFIQRPGEKPEILAQVVATTSRFPTELLPGQSLAAGERLTSPSNSHFVAVEEDGAVVLCNSLNQKIWSLDADPDPAAALTLTEEGTLTVTQGGETVWAAEAPVAAQKLILTDDGALQLLGAGDEVVWSSTEAGYQLRGGDSPYTVSPDGWTLPGAGPVSSPFGMRIHPIYRVSKLHSGVDMTSGRGKPIFAAHDGKVTRVYQDSGGNWTIEIDHGGSVMTRYLHMDGLGGILVQEGDEVVAGEQIARTGSSGQSTGPHLHFEVAVNGDTIDPIPFLAEHGVTLK